jgi:REP element-mobilizing transposase RayT
MPGTYSQILLHVVFSTKQRRPWLTPDLTERLHEYIGGVIRTGKGTLYAIGGAEDHLHLYLRWRTDEAISDLLRDVKAKSSSWFHEKLSEAKSIRVANRVRRILGEQVAGESGEGIHCQAGRTSPESRFQVGAAAVASRA